jgi:polar amino acid transport system permease protein
MIDAFLTSIGLGALALEPPGRGAVLLAGLVNSLYVAVGAYSLGLVIGGFGACGKLYGSAVIRDLLEIYTTVVRAIPELVLILLLYYTGTDLVNQMLGFAGYAPIDINGLIAGILVLGVNQGAYMTEIIRGSIKAVPAGELEAGRAFGMGTFKIFWRITLPAMLPHAIPGLGNMWQIATKDTALLAVVGYIELTLATRQAAGATGRFMTFFLAAGAIYLTISLLSNVGIRFLERRYRRGMGRPVG